MGITGCNVDGYMDATKFSKPMPWIGVYIAAASLACLLAVAADLAHAIRARKLWFPCKYFCLNATSLSIIAVAVKLSVDLNTPLPHRHDQLAKLSSSALICTIMGNSVPSLGVTDGKETMMNVVAMGILVITMIVNICIQFATGVIYVFWPEHAVIMFLMLLLLMTMFSSALTIPKMKHHLELKYKINESALKDRIGKEEEDSKSANRVINDLRDELIRVWMMAHTSSPQFVVGRSVTCTASGAFCLLSTVTFSEAMIRSYLMPWSFRFCSGESDYKWSTIVVLIFQVAVVAVGTIAPAFRWFVVIHYRCPNARKLGAKKRFSVEGYWTERLVLMKERPIGRIRNRKYRKFAHDAKSLWFNFLIRVQVGIVLMSKATQFVSVSLMCLVLACCDYCQKLKSRFRVSVSSLSSSGAESRLDLRRFVLHLEGEEELVEVMMKKNRDATNHWFQIGEKNQPKHLIELIEQKSTILQAFKGVSSFDSDEIHPLHAVEAPYSWSLPLVTLASIIVALPNIDRYSVRNLMSTLNEGILYVKFIETNLDREGKLIKLRVASEIVWVGVDLYHKWLDFDLYNLSLQCKNPKEALERLSEVAKIKYHKFKAKYHHICMKVEPSLWPMKVHASNSMYRITQTILLNHGNMMKDDTSSERLFEALKVMVSDILGACLTNLPHVISKKCLNSAIEEREDSVRHAVHMLGQTKRIIEMVVDKGAFPCLDLCRGTNIEDWRLIHKKQNCCLSIVPFSLENDYTETTTPESSDLCLNID